MIHSWYGAGSVRAGLPERAGVGDELLRELHQPARRAHAARLFRSHRPGALRQDAPGLDDVRGRPLVDSRAPAPRFPYADSHGRHDATLVTGRSPLARRGARWIPRALRAQGSVDGGVTPSEGRRTTSSRSTQTVVESSRQMIAQPR